MKWKYTKDNEIPEPYTMCFCDMQDHYEVLCWESNKTYSSWCLNTPDNEFYYELTDVIRWVYLEVKRWWWSSLSSCIMAKREKH